MLTTYRLFKTKHAGQWFDGEGAYMFGGRWNSPGTRVLYTAQSLSLALLEILVHLDSDQLLSAYSYATVSFELDAIIDVESLGELPSNWAASPTPLSVQAIGDEWARSRNSLAMSVPTSIVPGERNFVINVGHPEFSKVVLGEVNAIAIDPRLKAGF